MSNWNPGPEDPYRQDRPHEGGMHPHQRGQHPHQPGMHPHQRQQGGYPPAPQQGGYPPAPPQQGGYNTGVQQGMTPFGAPASMGNRLVARLIDGLIVGVPSIIVFFALAADSLSKAKCTTDSAGATTCTGGISGKVLLAYLLILVIGYAYEIYFIGTKGQTIGKKVMGVKVVDAQNGQPIGAGRAFLRMLVLALTGGICTLGYWSPFFDNTKRYQGWHDKAGSDFVIAVPK